MAKKIPDVVPSLVGALQHTNVNTSPVMLRHALKAIAAFGQQAEAATNAVASFLTHSSLMVAAEATNTLRSIQNRP